MQPPAPSQRMRRTRPWALYAMLAAVAACRLGNGPVETARDFMTNIHKQDCSKAFGHWSTQAVQDAQADAQRRGVDVCQSRPVRTWRAFKGRNWALKNKDAYQALVVVEATSSLTGAQESYLIRVIKEGKAWKVSSFSPQ